MQNIIMFGVVYHNFKTFLFYNKIVELNMGSNIGNII